MPDLDVIVVHLGSNLDTQLQQLPELLIGLSPPRVVGLHDELPASDFDAARQSGVTVLVDLDSGFDAILEAIVGTRERSLRRWVRPQLGVVALTRREREVLESLALGLTSAEIAGALGISSYTVEHHKGRVFRKLSATSQSQAVAIALRSGLIDTSTASELTERDDVETSEIMTTATVIGPRTLLTRSTARVLQSGGVSVVPIEAVSQQSVAVVVEPSVDEWAVIADTRLPAIVLTAAEPDNDALLAFVAKGAYAVLPTDCEPAHLVAITVQVANGDTGLTRLQTRQLVDALRGRTVVSPEQNTAVTPRELEILETLDRGLSVKQAARELGISPRTVENTRRVLYRKLGVRNRAEAIATAYASRLIGRS
jgi:DNA-binding NarL/FixJ family response regulator